MAFNMNRSIIKGTKLHKASVAKARQSTVSQTRMQADPGLVKAGRDLGLSYAPGAIDYGLDTKADLDFKREKEKQGDYVLGCMDSKATNYSAAATKDDGNCTYDELEGTGSVSQEDIDIMNSGATFDSGDGNGDGSGDGSAGNGDGAGTSNYVEEDDVDYTDEDIEADLARIGDGDGGNGQPTEFTNEQWELEQEQEAIRAANELQARLDTESATRAHAASTILPMQQSSLIPTTNTPEMELKKAGPAPEYEKTPKAHDNPDYDIEASRYDNEGNLISLGGVTNSTGYSYGVESDQWTYNGNLIEPHEVPEEFVDSQDEQNEARELRNRNNVDSTETVTPEVATNETTTTPPEGEQILEKPRMSDFEGNWFQRAEQYKEAMRAYKEKYDVKYKKAPTQRRVKSEAELRYDKIFKNAVPGGIAQQTMLKNGYKNK
jgi:hypothetical protein